MICLPVLFKIFRDRECCRIHAATTSGSCSGVVKDGLKEVPVFLLRATRFLR
jgi:hypothetical protein